MKKSFQDPDHKFLKALDASGRMIAHLILVRRRPAAPTRPGTFVSLSNPLKSIDLTAVNLEFRAKMGEMSKEVMESIEGVDHIHLSPILRYMKYPTNYL